MYAAREDNLDAAENLTAVFTSDPNMIAPWFLEREIVVGEYRKSRKLSLTDNQSWKCSSKLDLKFFILSAYVLSRGHQYMLCDKDLSEAPVLNRSCQMLRLLGLSTMAGLRAHSTSGGHKGERRGS